MRVSEFLIKSIDGMYVFFESSQAFFGLRWHKTGILCLFLLLGFFSACLSHIGVGWGCLVAFFAPFSFFCTCQVGHFELTCLILHAFSISTNFCLDCLTLQKQRVKAEHQIKLFQVKTYSVVYSLSIEVHNTVNSIM